MVLHLVISSIELRRCRAIGAGAMERSDGDADAVSVPPYAANSRESMSSGRADALSVPPYAARTASTIEVSGFVDHADHTAYEVKLGQRVVSAKRYSAFRDFHAQIFAALALDPRFPIPKAVRHSASLKRDRVAKLSQYLQQVCERAPGTAAALGALIAFLCLLYTSASPRDGLLTRMPSSA